MVVGSSRSEQVVRFPDTAVKKRRRRRRKRRREEEEE